MDISYSSKKPKTNLTQTTSKKNKKVLKNIFLKCWLPYKVKVGTYARYYILQMHFQNGIVPLVYVSDFYFSKLFSPGMIELIPIYT